MKNFKYKGIKLCGNAELAKELGINTQAVRQWRNTKKTLLLRLGLTYKKKIDNVKGEHENQSFISFD